MMSCDELFFKVRKPVASDLPKARLCFVDHFSSDNAKGVGVWVLEPDDACSAKLEAYIVASDSLVKSIGLAPRSVSEYAAKADSALKQVPQCPHWPRTTDAYMRKWTIRSYLLSIMAASKVDGLTVDRSCKMSDVISMNPDMTSGLTRLRSHFLVSKGYRGLTGKQFLAKCGAGRAELFSMWLCFAIDRGLQPGDFKKYSADQWWAMAEKMLKETGVYPHIAEFILVLFFCIG
jgi:hypothetical protein